MEPPWSGPMLLCVPGLGLDGAAWRPTLRALEAAEGGPWQHEVAPLPAYGARPRRSDDLRPAALGARLAAGLDTGGPPRVLAGHSASCQIAAHAARIVPDRVAGLVLVGPTTDPRANSWPWLVARWLRTAVHERPGQVPLLVRTYTRIGLRWMLRAMEAARHDDIPCRCAA